ESGEGGGGGGGVDAVPTRRSSDLRRKNLQRGEGASSFEGYGFESHLVHNGGPVAQWQSKTRADISRRKRKGHSQQWLCYQDAGMARRRVTSSVKRRGAMALLL